MILHTLGRRGSTTHLAHNVFTTFLESFAEPIWDKHCSNLVATSANIYFESRRREKSFYIKAKYTK